MGCGELQYLFDYVCNTSLGIESRVKFLFKLIKYFKPTLSSTKILVSRKSPGMLHRELGSNLMSRQTIDLAKAIAHKGSYHNLSHFIFPEEYPSYKSGYQVLLLLS